MKPNTIIYSRARQPDSISQRLRQLISILPVILISLLLGCENSVQNSDNPLVQAHWDHLSKTLHISGETSGADETVEIHNATTGDLLGKAIVNADGSWTASTTASACEVHVELPSGTATTTVSNAPSDCSGNPLQARAITENDIPVGVLVESNPEPLNSIPNAVIVQPPQDITVNVGEPVEFSGTAIGSAIVAPFSYYWNFGGAAANSTVQNPGTVIFSRPGTYFISLSVSDNLGIPDPSPAVRTIIVNDAIGPINSSPIPTITRPNAGVNGSININVGESLFFSGSAIDPTGAQAFTYSWDFSGVAPQQFGPQPGNIAFTRAGTYLVTLHVTNTSGIRSAVPASLTVIVSNTTNFNQTPNGNIVKPRNDVTVNVGESLKFKASGRDPDDDDPLSYSWDFDGLAPNIFGSSSREGGTITFNNPGIFRVRMTVTDSLGAVDPNPPVRTITVLDPTSPPNNGALSNQIISPPVDVQISPGQSVFFSGQPAAASGQGPFQFFWSFDGAAVNSPLQTPGDISFPLPGQYIVQFFVMDLSGNVLGAPVSRTITVTDPSVANASIVSPVDGTSLQVGTPVNLIARVDNSNAFTSLSYNWNIRRVGGNTVFTSDDLSPGSFSFQQPGEYRIRFTVTGIDVFGNQTIESTANSRVTVTDPLAAATNAIAYPAQDMFITVGESITFQPTTAVFGNNLNYQWHFGGARTPSNQQIPDAVLFSLPGTFVITLRITGTDINGSSVNLYGERLITAVTPASNPIPGFPSTPGTPTGAPTPEGFINSPATNISVRVGTPVLFFGTGFDPIGSGPLTFIWSFGGAAPNIQSQTPGNVTFNRVGNYVVTLLVQNAQGQFDPTPPTVVVTVTP